MPTKQCCYTGKLAKPIVWTDPPAFWGAVTEERVRKYWRDYENRQRQAEQRVNQKLLQKMSLLIRHFKITKEGDAAALAWALAFKHVPGFKIIHQQKSKKGRKRKWDGQQLEDLLETVRSVKKRFGLTDRQALKIPKIKAKPFNGIPNSPSLRSR